MVLTDANCCRASRRDRVWMGVGSAFALAMPESVDIRDAVSQAHKEVASTG